jgi:phage shock protein A
MDDLLKKLNLLMKTTLADVVDEARQLVTSRGEGDSSTASTPDVLPSNQIAQLRKRIDESLQFEKQIQQRIHDLELQIRDWDQKADARLLEGDEAGAQYALDQMKKTEQHLALAESDLAEHQRIAGELISSVNDLEAALASQPADSAEMPTKNAVERFNEILADMRARVDQMSNQLASREDTIPPQTAESTKSESATGEVDDDLAKRRKRLSKPE